MSVLVPRIRTIGVRLSEEEYLALERFCVESGARSISDLARSAISSFLSHAHQENALASTVIQSAARIKELEQSLAELTARITQLQGTLREANERIGNDAAYPTGSLLPQRLSHMDKETASTSLLTSAKSPR